MDSISVVYFIVEFNGQEQTFKFLSDTEFHTVETVLRIFANADKNDHLTFIDKEDNSIVSILRMIRPQAIDYLSSSSNKMKRYILIVNKKRSKNIKFIIYCQSLKIIIYYIKII